MIGLFYLSPVLIWYMYTKFAGPCRSSTLKDVAFCHIIIYTLKEITLCIQLLSLIYVYHV